MPRAQPIIPSLNAGELSPWLEGRTDYAQYAKGLRRCENWLPLIQGPLTKRPGTRFVQPAKNSAKRARLIPFVFSDASAFVLEFGDGYIRFFKNRAQVVTGPSTPYEIVSPYLEADLAGIRFSQSADVVYLAHPSYAPQKLSHFSDTNWTIATISFIGGPFFDENPQGVTMTPADIGSITPDMTANTVPSGTASDSAAGANAFKVFDRDTTTSDGLAATSGMLTYDFPGATTFVADAYWLAASDAAPSEMPSKWTFEGFNGTTWLTLDTRDGENGWGRSEVRFYDFINTTAYQSYRLNWVTIDGAPAGKTSSTIAEFAIHQSAITQTPFNLTASATTGINGGAGFVASDVGRPIRLFASDGLWRTAKIAAVTSTTIVTVTLDRQVLPNLQPMARWQLGSWSAFDGYPRAVTFYGERLFWAGSNTQPQTLWGSVVGDYENHEPGTPDDAALNLTLSSSDVNIVKWMSGDEKGLLVGASRGEFVVRPSTTNSALTPTNAKANRSSRYGSGDVDPQVVDKAVIFVQRAGRKLRELAYNINVDGFQAADLALRAEHITAPSMAGLAYQSQPLSILWAPRADGVLAGMTYERDQDVLAWHRHTLGGYSDSGHTAAAIVESATVIPAADGSMDDLWLIVNRYINGATTRYIEFMGSVFDHTTEQADAFFVDCGLSYDGAPATVFTGLDHLEGETVWVLADGAVHPDRTVSSGSITLEGAASVVQVGLGFIAHAATERIEAGAADGTAQGRIKRIDYVTLRLYRTGGLKFGYSDDVSIMEEIDVRSSEDLMDAAPALISDDVRLDWDAPYETDGCIHLVSDRPVPATILAVMPSLETTQA